MPAPIGQESRRRKFLLRMTDREDAYVRNLAVEKRSSLNDTITGLIRDRMDADQAPAPDPPEPPPAPARPTQKAGERRELGDRGRASAAADNWAPFVGHIQGQTAITDPDQ